MSEQDGKLEPGKMPPGESAKVGTPRGGLIYDREVSYDARGVPKGTRFFARIRSCDIECPRCGSCYFVGTRGRVKNAWWDPFTLTFKCRNCGVALHLGIIAWPTLGGTRRRPSPDQTPDFRQAAELRATLYGIWTMAKRGPKENANVVATRTPTGELPLDEEGEASE